MDNEKNGSFLTGMAVGVVAVVIMALLYMVYIHA